ncbi:MAG TPA: hypothetical protein VIH86_01040 [Puia sp.]
MKNLITVYKPVGMTPLEAIKNLRLLNPELTNEKITYAGRLDPLARGLLLLLIGEEAKLRSTYLSLPKIYEFEMVFGLQTDTSDMLGYLKEIRTKSAPKNLKLFVNTFVNNFHGIQTQFYPSYSSKTVNGKPLFWWARNDKLSQISLPKHTIEIFAFKTLSFGKISILKLEQKVKTAVKLVNGDFRQEEILRRWNEFFAQTKEIELETAKFSIHCSSGTYVREIVRQIGEEIGSGALTIDILRTKIGKYSLDDAINL